MITQKGRGLVLARRAKTYNIEASPFFARLSAEKEAVVAGERHIVTVRFNVQWQGNVSTFRYLVYIAGFNVSLDS